MRNRRRFITGLLAAGSAAVAGCGDTENGGAEPAEESDPNAEVEAEPEPDESQQDQVAATLQTSKGAIEVELYGDRAPRTVDNFVRLATGSREWTDPETGDTVTGTPLYEDVLFHRVIDGFMIQTGDPTGTGRGGPGYMFDDEFHEELRHDGPGVLSMANSGPDTNGSQFFITLEATPHLDDRHSVFGQVTAGLNVVRDIGSVETDGDDRPVDPVALESVGIE